MAKSEQIRCRECRYVEVIMTSGAGCWGTVFCRHPQVEAAYKGRHKTGFVGYTANNSREPIIKTCPKWCPWKLEGSGK